LSENLIIDKTCNIPDFLCKFISRVNAFGKTVEQTMTAVQLCGLLYGFMQFVEANLVITLNKLHCSSFNLCMFIFSTFLNILGLPLSTHFSEMKMY